MKNKFSALPDYIRPEELEVYFNEFLKIYVNLGEVLFNLEELNELADRQWHTYELLSFSIKEQIENYLINIADYESYEIMDLLLVVIPKLGLEKLFNIIIQKQSSIKNIEVIRIIQESKQEYGNTVSDPYSSLKIDRTAKYGLRYGKATETEDDR